MPITNESISREKDPNVRKALALMRNRQVKQRVQDAGTPPEMQDYVLSGKEKQAADQDQADSSMEQLMAMQDGDGSDSEAGADTQQDKRKKALASKK